MSTISIHPSALATFLVLGVAGFILHSFLLALLWAGILAIATWPLYQRLEQRIGNTTASALLILIVGLCLVIPIVWLSATAIHEIHGLVVWLKKVNQEGLAYPLILDKLPAADSIRAWWEQHLARPDSLTKWIKPLLNENLQEAGYLLRVWGASVLHRLATVVFSLISLFFFYRYGDTLGQDSMNLCQHRLGTRWLESLECIPVAIRATVDGLVLVGVGVGFLVGIGYTVAGVGSPVLLGALTAIAAMIPFAAPLVFGAVSLYLGFSTQPLYGLLLFAWSYAVFFVADHFIRPLIIGSGTRLPFLLVLFGVLGGVETMGLIGLFIGPVAMVLLLTWWRAELALVEGADPA